jgi:hypothetical protein
MKQIKISEGLTETVNQLTRQADLLMRQLRAEIDVTKQFTIDFPDLYVLESDSKKRDRLRKTSNNRKLP